MATSDTSRPGWMVEAIKTRGEARKKAWEECEKNALALKEQGNQYFRTGDYTKAAAQYFNAIRFDCTKPDYFSNLAAVSAKLNDHFIVIEQSTLGLLIDPTHAKCRYRRLKARRALGFHQAALSDAVTIIRQVESVNPNDPMLPDLQREVKELAQLVNKRAPFMRKFNTTSNAYENDEADAWPEESADHPFTHKPEEDHSDSEDSNHKGNGDPCRYYNRRDGCKDGKDCRFSHSPDEMSERDLMGKNVCIYHILGICRFSDEKCNYSHNLLALPNKGWWTNELQRATQKIFMKPRKDYVSKKMPSQQNKRKDFIKHQLSLDKGKKKRVVSLRQQYSKFSQEDDEDTWKLTDEDVANLMKATGFLNDEDYELLCQGVRPWGEEVDRLARALF